MDDRVLLKVYYFGQILLQTSEGVKFICENPLDVVIPFTISFEELKGVICEKIDSEMSRKISCILYRYPIPVFGGFVQFESKYVTDEASLQEMFSMYFESRARISFIELYIEFEQSEADRNIVREDYNSDSEEEFESNYEVVSPDGDEEQGDGTVAPDVTDVANALMNEVPFEEPSFMRVLDLEAMHVPEFPEYMSVDGEFVVGMEFSSRESVIRAMKEVSMISRKHCWVVRRYNGSHTCTRSTISQDHSKLDSNTIAEAIKPLVEADPSLKVKSVIADVQAKFNYTVSYQKAWLAKQKAVEKIFGGWEASYEALPIWFEAMCHKEPSAIVHFETMPAYQGDDLVSDIRDIRGRCVSTKCVTSVYENGYALTFDGGYRWGHMTTNLVECINSVLKGARNLPITALVKATFYRLNELFTRKRAEAEARINAGHCVRCLVDWSMLSTYVGINVTVVSFRWIGSRVGMCLHVVQINDWTGNCMCMMCIRWTRFVRFIELGLGHWEILLHGLLTPDRDHTQSIPKTRGQRSPQDDPLLE
ncbi:uncharacterized protein DS421_15g519390 [Arachis hypogaea]|nr:uncharacterized protein DS421_15g519390 [Arachis hypogaea]